MGPCRERERQRAAQLAAAHSGLQRGASDRGLVVVVIWTFIRQTDVSLTDGNLYPIAIPPSLYPPSDPGSDPPLGRCPRRGVPDHHRQDQLTPGGGSVPLTPALPCLACLPLWPTLAEPEHGREPEERRGAHRNDEGCLPATPSPPPLPSPARGRGQKDGGEMLETDGQGSYAS